MSSSSSDIGVSAIAARVVEQTRVFQPHDQFIPYDAKGDFVKGDKFHELCLKKTRDEFNEDDENPLFICKNMLIRIHETSD